MEDEAGNLSWGQVVRGPAHHTRENTRDTHRWKGEKGDADQGKGGCDQTAFPRFGCLVSVANCGQCDLKREEFRREASQGEDINDVSAELHLQALC